MPLPAVCVPPLACCPAGGVPPPEADCSDRPQPAAANKQIAAIAAVVPILTNFIAHPLLLFVVTSLTWKRGMLLHLLSILIIFPKLVQ
jgi:hypothetical protein